MDNLAHQPASLCEPVISFPLQGWSHYTAAQPACLHDTMEAPADYPQQLSYHASPYLIALRQPSATTHNPRRGPRRYQSFSPTAPDRETCFNCTDALCSVPSRPLDAGLILYARAMPPRHTCHYNTAHTNTCVIVRTSRWPGYTGTRDAGRSFAPGRADAGCRAAQTAPAA